MDQEHKGCTNCLHHCEMSYSRRRYPCISDRGFKSCVDDVWKPILTVRTHPVSSCRQDFFFFFRRLRLFFFLDIVLLTNKEEQMNKSQVFFCLFVCLYVWISLYPTPNADICTLGCFVEFLRKKTRILLCGCMPLHNIQTMWETGSASIMLQ